ncbi:MAG: extracellular solute-binding protein [Candidatus Aenigmarchaeota archaeon]|nr:extracellular solute-binding protein [Candidatus Aenigmarchaeota archaeon]
MDNTKILIGIIAITVIAGILWAAQSSQQQNEVVIYVAHDQDYSEPILKEFERETGITTKILYDTELTKTVGLVNKLIAEKSNPRADVFWNNEVSRSIQLKNENVFQPYCSPSSIDIPAQYKDGNCYWTGFAARARVILYNTNLVSEEEEPNSFLEFADEKWKGKTCIANPLFGTTGTHVASLFALFGDEKAKQFFLDLKENEIQIVSSNSMVRDQVVAGECWVGITDTDDANDAIVDKKPVKIVFPDQGNEQIGTLVIPNSVALIKGAPNEKNGKILIDYLLSKEVEKKLSETKAIQIPTRDVETPKNVPKLSEIKGMSVNDYQIFEKLKISGEFVQNIFLR